MSFENKIALVTGASRGIGRAIAFSLGKAGATVVGTATSESGAEKISANFAENNIQGRGLQLNVTDQDSIDLCVKTVTEQFACPGFPVNPTTEVMLMIRPQRFLIIGRKTAFDNR